MSLTEILRFSFTHEYYDDALPPLDAVLDVGDRNAGLFIRHSKNTVLVLADDTTERPDQVHFSLRWKSPEVPSITKDVNWGTHEQMAQPLGKDKIVFKNFDTRHSPSDREIAEVSIDLPKEGMREASLRFTAPCSHWAYFLIGVDATTKFEIIDQTKEIAFDDIGNQALPDGREARVLRSRQALPVRNRPTQRFSLQRDDGPGHEVLIPVLPVPDPQFISISEPGVAARLQSNIYISL